MNNESKHTPLPWRKESGASLFYIKSQSGRYVARLPDDAQGEVDADFILCACNSHYELLEALKVIAGITFDFDHSAQHREEALKIVARAAIAKAEGRES